MARVRTGLGVLWDWPRMVVSTAVRGVFVFLGHDYVMCEKIQDQDEKIKGQEQTARDDAERVTIFRRLADEYLELADAVGPVSEDEQTIRHRTALSLRLMLERKFVAKKDKNTYLPKVLNALKRLLSEEGSDEYLDQKLYEYRRIVSGESTGVSGSFNHVELEFDKVREVFAYGRLMHSDRDKFVSADVLERKFLHLLVQQTKLLAQLIADLRDFIDRAIKNDAIPVAPDSLRETWLEIHDNPEVFGLGKRKSSEEIPALNDDGTEPLPGGPRTRTVSFVIPELGRSQAWRRQFGEDSSEY